MLTDKILEIACFNLESAISAQASGADRIELCENYKEGGLTPSYELIKTVREKLQIPLHVIIRPQSESFVYSENEIGKMVKDILFCKEYKIDGVVLGVLTKDNEIDLTLCKKLIDLARPMSVTFHRAFDECSNLQTSIKALVELGVNRVLTSGGKGNAENNIPELIKLQNNFGNKIVIMPGGGIRSSNLKEIMKSECTEFHSAAITAGTEIVDTKEVRTLKQLLTQPL